MKLTMEMPIRSVNKNIIERFFFSLRDIQFIKVVGTKVNIKYQLLIANSFKSEYWRKARLININKKYMINCNPMIEYSVFTECVVIIFSKVNFINP